MIVRGFEGVVLTLAPWHMDRSLKEVEKDFARCRKLCNIMQDVLVCLRGVWMSGMAVSHGGGAGVVSRAR